MPGITALGDQPDDDRREQDEPDRQQAIGRAFALKSRIGVEVAGPEQDRRQEQQEDEVRLELDRRQRRARTRGPSPPSTQQDRVGDADPPGDVGQRDGDDEQAEDQFDRADAPSAGARRLDSAAAGTAARAAGAARRHASSPATSSGSSASAGSKPKTWPRNDSSRLERAPDRVRAAEAVALALEREVGMRDAVRGQRRDDRLGLRRRHDLVVEALEDEDRARDPVGEVDRRSLAVERRRLRDTARPAGRS